MAGDARIELHHRLDGELLGEVLALIEHVTEAEGHRPVGEHKHAHLRVGATDWSGALARDRDGLLVAYAHVRWNAPGRQPRMAVELVLDPAIDRAGVASRLLEAVEALLARTGGGLLWLWAHRVSEPGATLAARLGFRVQRELAFMRRPLEVRPDPAPLPPGVVLRPYQGEADDGEFLRVNNRAFVGHPENGDWTREDFAARRELGWFDPDDLLMAWQGERLVGFHWTKWHGHDSDEVPAHGPVGEVYVLAVDPDAQGSGLGRSLLEVGLAHLHDRGCRLAVLYVDRASDAAVRLYERAGFAIVYHEVCYERAVEARETAEELSRPASD